MKSDKAQANHQSENTFRLGILSLLGVMILSLSVGRPAMADDDSSLKLWKTDVAGKAVGKEITKTLSEEKTKEAVNLLFPDATLKGIKDALKMTDNAAQFANVIKDARLQAIGKGEAASKAFNEKLEKDVRTFVKGVDTKEFFDGNILKHRAYLELINLVSKMDEAELRNGFLTLLLAEHADLFARLGLTSTAPVVADDRDRAKGKEIEDLRKEIADLAKKISAPPVAPLPGERVDADILKLREFCRKQKESNEKFFADLAAKEETLKGLAQEIAARPKLDKDALDKKKNDNVLQDLIAKALADARKEDKNPTIPKNEFPNTPTGTQPTVASSKGALDKDAPPAPEEKKGGSPYFPTSTGTTVQPLGKLTSSLPDASVSMRALDEADAVVARLNTKPSALNKLSLRGPLTPGDFSVQTDLQKDKNAIATQIARLTAEKRKLQREVTPLLKDTMSAIDPRLEKKQKEIQTKLQEVDQNLQQTQQLGGRLGDDEDAQQAWVSSIQKMQADKKQLTNMASQVEEAIQDEVKKIKPQVAMLNEMIGDIDSTLGSLREKDAAISAEADTVAQIIQQKKSQQEQAEMAALTPSSPRTTNASRTGGGFGGGGGSGRRGGSAVRGSLGLESAMSAGEQRKPLSGGTGTTAN